jgi:hypothetical protein
VKAVKISTISPSVLEWFSKTREGHILQVFDQSCNVVNQRDELISLVVPAIGPGPFSAVIELACCFIDSFNAGDPVQVEGSQFYMGEFVFDIKKAAVWHPEPDWSNIQMHRGQIAENVLKLIPYIQEHASRESLFQIVPQLIETGHAGALEYEKSSGINEEIKGKSITAAQKLLAGISEAQPALSKAGVKEMLGLGAGLTPAGDDFLVGIIFALWTMLSRSQIERMLPVLFDHDEDRTNQLSYAYLTAAMQGQAVIAWHSFLQAMTSDEGGEMYNAVRPLLLIGKTSGSDALAGFVCMVRRFVE